MAMRNTKILGATILGIAVLVTAVTLALLQSTVNLSNTGNVRTINVKAYQDSGCTIPLTQLLWGTVDPGTSVIKTMYIKNEGTSPMTLNMTTNTWNPTNAPTYLTVTWNQEDAIVNATKSVQANVTLSVSASVTGISGFAFTMVITGTG